MSLIRHKIGFLGAAESMTSKFEHLGTFKPSADNRVGPGGVTQAQMKKIVDQLVIPKNVTITIDGRNQIYVRTQKSRFSASGIYFDDVQKLYDRFPKKDEAAFTAIQDDVKQREEEYQKELMRRIERLNLPDNVNKVELDGTSIVVYAGGGKSYHSIDAFFAKYEKPVEEKERTLYESPEKKSASPEHQADKRTEPPIKRTADLPEQDSPEAKTANTLSTERTTGTADLLEQVEWEKHKWPIIGLSLLGLYLLSR